MSSHRLSALILIAAVSQPKLTSAQQTDLGLYQAIRADQREVVEDFLARGGDPNAIIPNSPMGNDRLLRIAFAGRREAIVLDLLRAGARPDIARLEIDDISYAGMDGALDHLLVEQEALDLSDIESALDVASALGHYDSVEVLLAHISARDLPIGELLSGAVASAIGDDDIARLLIEHGAPIDNAALRAAARISSPGMMRYLIQLGADLFEPYDRPSRPQNGYLAIDFVWDTYLSGTPSQRQAAAFKLFDLMSLGATSARVDASVAANGDELLARISSPSERLKAAAEWGFYDSVTEIVSGPTALDPTVLTEATTAALRAGWEDIARLLLENGAPPNGGPLHVAVRVSTPGIVRLLLELGADPDERLDGYAPVDYWLRDDPAVAAEHSVTRAENLLELIAGGADVCGLVARHLEEIGDRSSSYAALWNSAPECWPEQQ